MDEYPTELASSSKELAISLRELASCERALLLARENDEEGLLELNAFCRVFRRCRRQLDSLMILYVESCRPSDAESLRKVVDLVLLPYELKFSELRP